MIHFFMYMRGGKTLNSALVYHKEFYEILFGP